MIFRETIDFLEFSTVQQSLSLKYIEGGKATAIV